MTAQKEYSILFALGAKLNQTFSGSFSKAQQVLKETQNKVKELNQTQKDATAYQKQQESINKTSEKLATYQKKLDNVQKEMAKSKEFSKDLANEELDLKQKISDTEKAIQLKNDRLKKMEEELNKAGVDTSKLTEEIERLNSELKDAEAQEKQTVEEAEKAANSGVNAINNVSSALAAAGIAAALSKIADSYKECVAASMEFGYTMSTVEALSGANASEMKELSATAKELGASTAYTANQSATAMTYMGMAGWNAGQMIAGMDGVMSLAAASGEDLASVSDIVTDNLTAFGLKASDTAHFSDVLATAASKSNTSVGIMGETFKGSASIAGALGYSIEDIAVGVGLMANSGVKGSIAGTALKNTFNGLLSGATLTAEAFGEVEVSTVNTDGTMKKFSETINDLRGYFAQMTEAERVNNAIAIAGERGYNGLLAILNSTDEEYQALSDSINNCSGAARRMAEIKLDNLQGDVILLESATDGLKMTLGGLWDDELRLLAQAGTEILNKINEFVEKNPAAVKAIMVMVSAWGGFMIIATVTNMVKKFGGAISSLFTMNPQLLAMVGTIAALTAGVVALREAYKRESLESQNLSAATQNQRNEVERLNSEYEEACQKYGKTSDQARALKYDLDEATAAIDNQSFSVSELYSRIDALHSSTADLINSCNEGADSIAEEQENAHVLAAKLQELTSSSNKSAAAQEQIEPIIARLNEMYPQLGLTIDNVSQKMGGLNAQIDQAANSQGMLSKYEAARAKYDDLILQQEKLLQANNQAEATLSQARKNYLDSMEGEAEWWEWIANIGYAAGKNLTWLATQQPDVAKEELHNASEAANMTLADLRAVQEQIAECERIMEEFGDTVNGTSENAVSASDAVSIAVHSVTEETQNLLTAYNEAYQAAYESVNGQYALWEQAAEISVTSVETINSALESQADYWESYNSNLGDLLERSEKIEGLRDIIASFSDGSADSYNAIAGMVAASDDELKTMVENWKTVQEEQGKVSEALADTKVDFETRLGEITESMSDLIEGMNMEADAKEAAQDTMEAYAEAILAGKTAAVDAAEQVNFAVSAALSKISLFERDNLPDIAYEQDIAVSNVQYPSSFVGPIPYTSGMELAVNGISAYASGTDNAKRGWAMVGENGPELAYFGGGEQVFTANETKAILEGGNNTDRSFEKIFIEKSKEISDLIILENALKKSQASLNAYASGTDHVEKGWAMVGENGPEPAYFGGGEQVFTTAETKAILGSGNNSSTGGNEIVIAPQLYINESSGGDKTDWQEIADLIVEQVRDALKNEEIDARRKAYV